MTADVGFLAALAAAEAATATRLHVLLRHHPAPDEALAVVLGRAPAAPAVRQMLSQPTRRERAPGPALGAAWAAESGRTSPDDWTRHCVALAVDAVVHGSDDYPSALLHDPQPPAVLFRRGDPSLVDGRSVAIVGTRNATAAGQQFAAELGRELAAAGVVVVSGLARGIDAAAHRGVLTAAGDRSQIAALGVVANGVGEPYPRSSAALWQEVATRGLLVSEWPPGTVPERFRFPQRNRIIAALAEVVVVVESRETGGSLSTVAAALERGIDVMAVPGAVHSRAATGTNRLIRDGAAPVTEIADVFTALGLTHRAGLAVDPRPLPRGLDAELVEQCRARPATLDDIVVTTGLEVTDAAMALARLERSGWLREAGGWFEAVDVPPAGARSRR